MLFLAQKQPKKQQKCEISLKTNRVHRVAFDTNPEKMQISKHTQKTLKKAGFIRFSDTIWAAPYSGRMMVISDGAILSPADALSPFQGIHVPPNLHDAFISNVIGQLNEIEHPAIDTLVNS